MASDIGDAAMGLLDRLVEDGGDREALTREAFGVIASTEYQRARLATIEECAQVADSFLAGVYGQDGKTIAQSIRALADKGD